MKCQTLRVFTLSSICTLRLFPPTTAYDYKYDNHKANSNRHWYIHDLHCVKRCKDLCLTYLCYWIIRRRSAWSSRTISCILRNAIIGKTCFVTDRKRIVTKNNWWPFKYWKQNILSEESKFGTITSWIIKYINCCIRIIDTIRVQCLFALLEEELVELISIFAFWKFWSITH